MASLSYGGPAPTRNRAVETRVDVEDRLDDGFTRSYVAGRVTALAASKATKTYVDAQDATFQAPSYFQAQDALNIPLSSKGQPNGVATLDGSGKVPLNQVPALGFGTLKGPYGVTNTFTGTTGTAPLKIAEWNIGVTAINFQPLVFMTAFVVVSQRGRPVIEVRIGNPTQTAYADQSRVAIGSGRSFYDDAQSINVLPARPSGSMSDGVQTYWDANFDARLTAWMYDTTASGQATMNNNMIANACVYLMRVSS